MRQVLVSALLLAVLGGCGSAPAPVQPPPDSGGGMVPPPKPSAPTLTVDPSGGEGKFKTLAEALQKAEPKSVIKVRPGTYSESITIDKDITLEGDGPAKDILIQAADGNVISIRAQDVNLTGVSVKQTGNPGIGVHVLGGHVVVSGCEITASGIGLLARSSATECHAKKNLFHACKGGGIQAIDGSICIAEDNELTGCDVAALSSRRKADSIFRRNKILNSKKCGIMVYEQGSSLVEDNEIRGSAESGIVAINNHHCVARGNKITGSGGDGVFVTGAGKGTFENNDIRDNKQSGVSISAAEANVLKNRISGNLFGVSSLENAGCRIDDNEITGSLVSGIILSDNGSATARGNTISKNRETGVLIWKKGKGLLDNNTIVENGVDGITIIYEGTAMGSRNTIHDNGAAGIRVSNGSSSEFKDNDVYDNGDVDSVLRNRKAPPAGKFKPSPQQKGWALACTAVMMHRDGMRHDLLAGDVRTPDTIAAHAERMKKAWGITDKTTLLAKLKWVDETGYRKEFESQAATLRLVDDAGFQKRLDGEKDPERQQNLSLMRTASMRYDKKSMLGYDLNNFIALCRWGYLAGYLNEAEAWDLIVPRAQLLQKTFESFESVGENYNVGIHLSSPDKELRKETQNAFEELRKDIASPWKKYLWNTKLD